jgi:hypothetical protein
MDEHHHPEAHNGAVVGGAMAALAAGVPFAGWVAIEVSSR